MGINYIKYAKISIFNQDRAHKKAVYYISVYKAVKPKGYNVSTLGLV